MGDGDKTTPIVAEFLGRDHNALIPAGPDLGARPRSGAPLDIDASICPPLHRMHEQRVVRSAGRMAIGYRMPAPGTVGAQPAHIAGDGTPVFYSHDERGSTVSRTAIAV